MLMDRPYLSRLLVIIVMIIPASKNSNHTIQKRGRIKVMIGTGIIIYYHDNANRVFNGLALLHLSFTETKVRI